MFTADQPRKYDRMIIKDLILFINERSNFREENVSEADSVTAHKSVYYPWDIVIGDRPVPERLR